MSPSRQPGTLLAHLQNRWDAEAAAQLIDLGPLGRQTASTWSHRARSSSGAEQDELLSALLAETRNGEVAAAAVLVHALVPAVRRATASLQATREYAPEDRAGAVVAATWEAVHCHHPDLHRHVFMTLLREARRVLAPAPTANQRHITDKTITVEAADLVELAGPQPTPTTPPEIRLAAILTWARDTHVLTPVEIDLLTRSAIAGDPATTIANSLEVTVAALRKRVQRIQTRLATALQAQQ